MRAAAGQVYRVRYYKTLKIVKISEISEKNIFLTLNYFVSTKMMSETIVGVTENF